MNETLTAAICTGDLEATKQHTFAEGFFADYIGGTPLRLACANGHLEIAKYLVSIGAMVAPYNHLSLYHAITNGHLHIVEYLVSIGFDITNDTLFASHAAGRNQYDILVFLVENGAPTRTLSERHKKYVAFVQKMRVKIEERERRRRERAQKRIYYWWIPICHDPNRESGKRMMQRSFEKSMAGELC
jgi:hypothetical protein